MSRLLPGIAVPNFTTKRLLTVAAESPAALAQQINAQIAILQAEPQVGTEVLTIAGIAYGAAGAGGRYLAAMAIATEDSAGTVEGYPINVPAGAEFLHTIILAVEGTGDISEQTPTVGTALPPSGPTLGEQLQRAENDFVLAGVGITLTTLAQIDTAGANMGHRFGVFALLTYSQATGP